MKMPFLETGGFVIILLYILITKQNLPLLRKRTTAYDRRLVGK